MSSISALSPQPPAPPPPVKTDSPTQNSDAAAKAAADKAGDLAATAVKAQTQKSLPPKGVGDLVDVQV